MKKLSYYILPLISIFLLAADLPAAQTQSLGEIKIETTRSDRLLMNVNRGVSVITSDVIEGSTASTVAELLEQGSPILLSNYLGNPKGAKVDIRGFGETGASNILVLVDGRRTNQVDLSGVDWGQIGLFAVKEIQVIRGGASVLYGDNASGGVINIITKKGEGPRRVTAEVISEGGSHQYNKEGVTVSGVDRIIEYVFGYSYEKTDGYRANDYYWANDYFGNVTITPNDKLSLDTAFGHHRDKYGLPGALFASDIKDVGRRGTTHDDDRAWTSDSFVTMTPKIRFDIGVSDAEFSFLGAFRRRFNKSVSVSSWGNYESAHKIDSFELQPKLEMKSEVGWFAQNHLTAGFDYFNAKDKIRSGNQTAAQDFVDINKETFSPYALNQVVLDEKWLMDVGARAVWAEYDFKQKDVLRNKEAKSIDEAAFNFGGGFKYRRLSQVYFDYSRSYRLPMTDEFYQNTYVSWSGPVAGGLNTNLEHQVANNFELGLRDNSFDWLYVNGNLFLMDVKNEIYYDPISFKNTNYKPKTRHYGFELESRTDFFDGMLKPYVNWTIQETFFKGGSYTGNQVPFVPKNKVSAGIVYSPIDLLNHTFSVNYVSKRFAISDQANSQPRLNSRIIFDWKSALKFKDYQIWGAVKNIFDNEYNDYGVYSSSKGQVGYYPAPERTYQAGVKVRF